MGPYLAAWTGAGEGPRYRGGCPTGGHNLSSKVCKACPTIDWPTYRRQRKVDTRGPRGGEGPSWPIKGRLLRRGREGGKKAYGYYRATTVNWGYMEKRYLTIQIKGTRFSTRRNRNSTRRVRGESDSSEITWKRSSFSSTVKRSIEWARSIGMSSKEFVIFLLESFICDRKEGDWRMIGKLMDWSIYESGWRESNTEQPIAIQRVFGERWFFNVSSLKNL